MLKLLVLPKYSQLGASSRMRLFQYVPQLAQAGAEVTVSPLLSDAMLQARYQHGGYGVWPLLRAYSRRLMTLLACQQFDLVWIEKEALPWLPAWFERLLFRRVPYVLDFDDAIFHNYDLHRVPWIRYLYGMRIDRLMVGARLVVTGNRYLADRATAASAQWVEVLPTVVDLVLYAAKHSYRVAAKPRIVWIGSPSTVPYLLALAQPLSALAQRQPFSLRVIGGGVVTMPGVEVEAVNWSADTEAAQIAECDVGIMPLKNSPWEQGKCAYKLIQYMACGLPTVASSVGANRDVLREGETGFFADTDDEWIERIEMLLCNVALRQRLGQAGRVRVEANYCLQQTAPRLVRLLMDAGVH
ncbi:MAG: glycosyltransferase family 4 protein [Methylococcales bacterium]|nr:glycosyltransferase family 4 protein [Methylococcales bacterium]